MCLVYILAFIGVVALIAATPVLFDIAVLVILICIARRIIDK